MSAARIPASAGKLVSCLALALAGSLLPCLAHGQTNSFTYELRIVPENVFGFPVVPPQGGRISFWLEARSLANSLAPNFFNYGVMRVANGPQGQTAAFITVTDAVPGTRLERSVVQQSGPGGFALTGRGPLFRSGGPVTDSTSSPWHSASENGPGGTAFPQGENNQFGAFDQAGDRLYGFDAYAGPLRSGDSNPWLSEFPSVPVGNFSAWYRMYKFDLVLAPGGPRSVTLNAAAYLSAGIQYGDIGGGLWLSRTSDRNNGSQSTTAPPFSFIFPTPGTAAVAGLGLVIASRRRR